MNIDRIMNMLDCDNPPGIQEQGRQLAGRIMCIKAFIQPGFPYGERVWENCASVLASKEDTELITVFGDLFEWIREMDAPGAERIYERLVKTGFCASFEWNYDSSYRKAAFFDDKKWLNTLERLKEERERQPLILCINDSAPVDKDDTIADCDDKFDDIDAVLETLSWPHINPSEEEEALNAARSVKCITAFLQPIGHQVWENCAIILSEKTDEELQPYLHRLFMWLQDLNWPGAMIIYDRLLRFRASESYGECLRNCLKEAYATKDHSWFDNLKELEKGNTGSIREKPDEELIKKLAEIQKRLLHQ